MVVFPKIENAKNIKSILVKSGLQVSAVCTSGSQAIYNSDSLSGGIVVCGHKMQDMMYNELNEYLSDNFNMLLVASQNICNEGVEEGIVSLAMPIKVHDLVNTVEMMVYTYERRKKKMKLKPKHRDTKEQAVISEAKSLLMERNNMTENEAHKYIQKCSMDSATNMVETAEMILSLLNI